MQPGRPSVTALRVAERRAAHQLLDRPLVLDDPLALRIIGSKRAASLQAGRRRYGSRFGRYLRAFLAARSRCAEDALAAAISRGTAQYVVLGAGLDTFAYRNPYPASVLRVFEVDHPATQAWKLDLLERTRIAIPEGLTFVPVDFATDKFSDRLRASGFRDDLPTFYSWLGVTMYLEREPVFATLRHIAANTPAGGGIVFDFALAPAALGLFGRLVYKMMAWRVASVGEPFRSTFDPRRLIPELVELGYARVEHLGGHEINARYFAQHADGLKVGSLGAIISAEL